MDCPDRLFLKDGLPARFFIHSTIDLDTRQKLTVDIEAYAGCVASTDDHVDTVLVSTVSDIRLCRLRYLAHRDACKRSTHVEQASFVQHCIQQKHFLHAAPRIDRQFREKKFTLSDDRHLCAYLARIERLKGAGRRSDSRPYKHMEDLAVEFPEFSWVMGHTRQAWRERYEKKKQIFDRKIERIAKEEKGY